MKNVYQNQAQPLCCCLMAPPPAPNPTWQLQAWQDVQFHKSPASPTSLPSKGVERPSCFLSSTPLTSAEITRAGCTRLLYGSRSNNGFYTFKEVFCRGRKKEKRTRNRLYVAPQILKYLSFNRKSATPSSGTTGDYPAGSQSVVPTSFCRHWNPSVSLLLGLIP